MEKNQMFRYSPVPKLKREAFDLSHETKLSTEIGKLTPIMWFDCVPGDTFNVKNEVLVKFAPMLAPLLHRVDVFVHSFFVQYRLLMNRYSATNPDWDEFIANVEEEETLVMSPPYITINNANKAKFVEGSLADYLGLPIINGALTVHANANQNINAFPFFAYHLIYDEYYRDQNLIDRKTVVDDSGAAVALIGGDRNADIDYIALTTLYSVAYEKDYFRGALPFAYTGSDTDVEMHLDVLGDEVAINVRDITDSGYPSTGDVYIGPSQGFLREAGPGNTIGFQDGVSIGATAYLEIMELRRAQAITRFLEAEARGGRRYVEWLLSVFGVISDDARTHIPEYLGGGRQPVQISSVLNQSQVLDPTAGVNDGVGGAVVTVDPQALETGRGLSVGSTNGFTYYVKDHGMIMTLMSVKPRTAYYGGIEKFWNKLDRLDFFLPQLQGIGDQEILKKELEYDYITAATENEDIWGYAPRWAEYKFKNSTVHGAFRSSLDYWHMGYGGAGGGIVPGDDLNETFISIYHTDDWNKRCFADQSLDDKLFCQVFNSVRAIRPMRVHDIGR